MRWVLYEEDGEQLGFAYYRQFEKWEGGLAANRVTAGGMTAVTPTAEEGLWQYMAGIDLVRDIESWNTDPGVCSVTDSTVNGAVARSSSLPIRKVMDSGLVGVAFENA